MPEQPSEKEWTMFLKTKPLWEPQANQVVVLSPHPDDETLGAGGLIKDLSDKNCGIRIISITDGERAYPEVSPQTLRDVRKNEQVQALNYLGVNSTNIIRLKMTDSALEHNEAQLEKKLLALTDKTDTLIAPWLGDFHPDHQATGRIAVNIAKALNIPLYFYFFWTWHHCRLRTISNLPLLRYPLSPTTLQIKQKALNCYVSQFKNNKKPILNTELVQPALRNFEVYSPYEYE